MPFRHWSVRFVDTRRVERFRAWSFHYMVRMRLGQRVPRRWLKNTAPRVRLPFVRHTHNSRWSRAIRSPTKSTSRVPESTCSKRDYSMMKMMKMNDPPTWTRTVVIRANSLESDIVIPSFVVMLLMLCCYDCAVGFGK